MPNLPAHIKLALQGAELVDEPVLKANLGSFILGCTAPDIRTITRSPRDETHFAPLDFQEMGAGVRGLLSAHPGLSDASRLNGPTRAFLLGYFHHILADEAWIMEVYRPFFGRTEHAEHAMQANLWDRALQLELDLAANQELAGMAEVRRLLAGSEVGVNVGFIGPETLAQWRQWVMEFTTWEVTWDRLKRMARRIHPEDTGGALALIEDFLHGMPKSLEAIYQVVPRHRVEGFQQRVAQEFITVAREYLSGVKSGPRPD